MMQRRTPPTPGAVLLLAILMTALVTSVLTAALWRQSALIQIESSERQRQQGQWLLLGAADWARLILLEDARVSSADHLSEPWAIPLMEGRLSAFLSAQPGLSNAQTNMEWAAQVYLSGSIQDAQGKFNLGNLTQDADTKTLSLQQFWSLWSLLDLPTDQAHLLLQSLAQTKGSSARLFTPRTLDDMAAWGLNEAVIERLRAHVVFLPERSSLNVNTASPEVLAAVFPNLSLAQAHRLVQERNRKPWTRVDLAQGQLGVGWNHKHHSIQSSYFQISGHLRMHQTSVSIGALVHRRGDAVSYVWVLPQARF